MKGKIKRKILKFAFYDGIKVIPALLIIVKIFYTIMLSLIPSYFDKHKNYLLQSQILLKCKKKKPTKHFHAKPRLFMKDIKKKIYAGN